MKILAIETCFGKFSLALYADGVLAASFASDEENKQAEKLLPAIEQMLRENKLEYKNLDSIAVAVGPGSFTGIRIGMAAAKGFALAAGIKLIGVSTLAAAADKKGSWPVYLNASRGDAFFQQDAGSEAILIPYTGTFDELPDAVNIGKIALTAPASPNIEPLYVRKPDAKLPVIRILSDMHARCFEKGWRQDQFQNFEYIIEEGKGFVAYQTVIDECEIKTICVLPEFRQTGVATLLMNRLTAKTPTKTIFLEVEDTNIPAAHLYKKLGFEVFNQRKDYYGPGRHAILMKLSNSLK